MIINFSFFFSSEVFSLSFLLVESEWMNLWESMRQMSELDRIICQDTKISLLPGNDVQIIGSYSGLREYTSWLFLWCDLFCDVIWKENKLSVSWKKNNSDWGHVFDYWVPYSFKQLSSKMLLQERKLEEMELQEKGLIEGGVRRALQHPLFMGIRTQRENLHLELIDMDV